jgi:hypothetical protein
MERDMANSENERLRVLVMDGRCSYCHRGLFESSGPPCQHLKHLEALSDLPEQEGVSDWETVRKALRHSNLKDEGLIALARLQAETRKLRGRVSVWNGTP